jgi:hypothetical protein
MSPIEAGSMMFLRYREQGMSLEAAERLRDEVRESIGQAIAAEREACAKLAEAIYGMPLAPAMDGPSAKTEAGSKIAAAIRARRTWP